MDMKEFGTEAHLERGKIVTQKKKPSGLTPFRKSGKLPKRNEPCPCGSGKKAKKCCLPKIKVLASIPPHLRGPFAVQTIFNRG